MMRAMTARNLIMEIPLYTYRFFIIPRLKEADRLDNQPSKKQQRIFKLTQTSILCVFEQHFNWIKCNQDVN